MDKVKLKLSIALTFLLALSLVARAMAGVPYERNTVGVTTASTSVLAASGARTLLILQNDSDTTIYCNLSGGAAVLGQGTRLPASGGGIVLDVEPPNSAVACIHGGSGTKNLLVTYS